MKKLLVSIICFFAILFASAQSPSFQWAKGILAINKISVSYGNSIAADAVGNVYVTGQFGGTVDFDPGPGTYNLTTASMCDDVFISKLDASGNLVWAKNMGGTAITGGVSITLDSFNNVYVVGHFSGTTDFDPGVGIDTLTATGSDDVFILKLDASGNFVFVKSIQGSTSAGSDYISGSSIILDAGGDIYTTGYFQGTFDFDPGSGIANLNTIAGGQDIFISKLDAAGNFVWAKQMVGTANGQGNSIALDGAGDVYTTGYFNGTVDFDPGAGTFNLAPAGSDVDAFISKLDASGNFVWAKNIGGTGSSSYVDGYSIGVDGTGNIYTTGYFHGTNDFDPGTGTVNLMSVPNDIFISKLDASGNFLWVKNMVATGSSQSEGYSLMLDGAANVYTTGYFHGTFDFDPGVGTFNLTSSSSGGDVYVLKLNAAGNFSWAVNMGGTAAVVKGCSIAVDLSNNVYTAGYFHGTADFDPGSGTTNLTSIGPDDIFVQKLSQASNDGINEYGNENTISIYPNPCNGVFNVAIPRETKPATIEIYNSIGDLVYSKQNIISQTAIDLSNQENGLYFLKVMSDGKIVGSRKIIKED